MEKQTVFRKVYLKDRLPLKRSSYLTNKGMYKWCKKYGFYNDSLFNIYKAHNIKWWLEEIELPSEEEILEYAREEQGLEDYDIEQDVFVDGANYILNKLK